MKNKCALSREQLHTKTSLIRFSTALQLNTRQTIAWNGARVRRHLLWDVVEVADVMELLHLVSHRRREVRVSVAESAGGDSRHEVKVFLLGGCGYSSR